MNDQYENFFNSERTVESVFIKESLENLLKENDCVLDVGGIPTNSFTMKEIHETIKRKKIDYKICDFRQCDYTGDFVKIDFKSQKFDCIIFLSSLEHFPQCTESDLLFREGYDKKGFEKAISILNPEGYIFLTVPFGKHRWQNFHQNYNNEGILNLTKGTSIEESYTYSLINNQWVLTNPLEMENILYTDKCYGVGCFILKKKSDN